MKLTGFPWGTISLRQVSKLIYKTLSRLYFNVYKIFINAFFFISKQSSQNNNMIAYLVKLASRC